jgi:RNA polymerase sigma factor for flagellar operon FliA
MYGKEQLILEHLEMVEKIAYNINLGRLPYCIDREDLVQCGMIGLIEAACRYRPGKATFKSYAYLRIRGAMIDEVRRLRHGNSDQVRAGPKFKPPEVVSIDATIADSAETYADTVLDPRAEMDYPQYIELIGFIEHLDYCARIVIEKYYWRELRLKEIGLGLGISEGRVCQIKARAHKKLRQQLETIRYQDVI